MSVAKETLKEAIRLVDENNEVMERALARLDREGWTIVPKKNTLEAKKAVEFCVSSKGKIECNVWEVILSVMPKYTPKGSIKN